MNKKLRVGVLMGGQSGEHEVSLASARSVIKALNKNKYEVVPIKIDRNGRWPKSKMILPRPKGLNLDVVIPIMHGTYGEDGKIQGLLELANLPYVGAGVLGSAVAMDKIIMRQLFKQAGLPVGKFLYFLKKDWLKQKNKIIKEIEKQLNYPVFVKPANLGSSIGISKAQNKNQLIKAVREASKFDRKIIIERAIKKARDIECSVLGNDEPIASIPGEIVPGDEFYSYSDKYIDGTYQAKIPAPFNKKILDDIQKIAVRAFKVLDLAGMARVDFLIENNKKIYLSEANTIPGFNKISMYPKLWEASGLPYDKLLDKLIDLAIERHQEKNELTSIFELGKSINV